MSEDQKAPQSEPQEEEKKEEQETVEETPTEEVKEEAPAEEKQVEESTPEETSKEEVQDEEPQEAEAPKGPAYKTKLVEMDDLKTGQTIRLHEKIKDISPKGEERERIQVFEGIILGFGGSGIARTVTLKKISGGISVEKIYPINSPVVDKIELVKTAKVRRAKLGYLKDPKKRFKRKLKEVHNQDTKKKKKRK